MHCARGARLRKPAYQAAIAQYQQTVLNALECCGFSRGAGSGRADFASVARRGDLRGAGFHRHTSPLSAWCGIASGQFSCEERWRKAHLSESQAIADRLVDTTGLFQAMGNRAEITTVAETERRTTATGRAHPVRQRVIAEGC